MILLFVGHLCVRVLSGCKYSRRHRHPSSNLQLPILPKWETLVGKRCRAWLRFTRWEGVISSPLCISRTPCRYFNTWQKNKEGSFPQAPCGFESNDLGLPATIDSFFGVWTPVGPAAESSDHLIFLPASFSQLLSPSSFNVQKLQYLESKSS